MPLVVQSKAYLFPKKGNYVLDKQKDKFLTFEYSRVNALADGRCIDGTIGALNNCILRKYIVFLSKVVVHFNAK